MADPIEEFNKKYIHTYIQYTNPGDKTVHPAYVELVNYNKYVGDLTVHLRVEALGLISLQYPKCLEILDLESPDAGYFNYNNNAIYLFKIPARQWQRGLCSGNHELYNPFRRLFTEGTYRPMWNRAIAGAIYRRNFERDIGKAIYKVRNEANSVAITKHLMVSKSPVNFLDLQQQPTLLWYKTTPVGFIKGLKIKVDDHTFEQEVRDELVRIGQAEWIF